MELKITLIGAGSVVFAKTLISDVLQFPELSHATICLMDIDPQRLKVAKVMAERIIQSLKVSARVIATTDRRKAIQNARYVICTIQVGGYKPGTLIDFEIPKKYGLQQTIGDTLGIGGIFRALRTIPKINEIAQDIAEVGAPDCLLLNYTNPMAMNCWAVDRATGIPHVGLCHSVQGTSHQLARYARLDEKQITYQVAGINHMAFFLKFEYKKQDAYPLLFKLLEDSNFKSDRVRFEMMRRTGYFVTESSEHQSEYVPYFIHHGKKTIEAFDVPIDEYLRRCEAIIRSWKSLEAALLGDQGRFEVPCQSHEYGSFIIHSRETNKPRIIYGNVPNRNLITNLPVGCCVEVPCLVDAQGIQPTHIGDLPTQLAAICQTNINVQALTVEAALSHKRESIYHAAMFDPHTAATLPLDKIWSLCDDLIAAHQKVGLLGEFKPTIQGTGRSFEGVGDRLIAKIEAQVALQKETSEIPLLVSVSNPTSHPQRLSIEITHSGNEFKMAPRGKLNFSLKPHQSQSQKMVAYRNQSDDLKPLCFSLKTDHPNIFTQDLILEPRSTLTFTKSAEFKMNLAGFPAVEASLTPSSKGLHCSYRVLDSKIAPAQLETPWSCSSIELFFASEMNSEIEQLFCVIDPRKKSLSVVNSRGRQIPGTTGKVAISSIDYKADFFIPMKALKSLQKNSNEFLFDCYVNIGALGDAHSGGRSVLSGEANSHQSSRHYSLFRRA